MIEGKTPSLWWYFIGFCTRNIFILSLVGFPLVALLISTTTLDSKIATLPFRIFIVLLGVIVLIDAFCRRQVGRPNLLLLIFFVAYIYRLVWDYAFVNLTGAMDALVFFAITTVIPILALWCANNFYFNDESLIAKSIIVIATIGCCLAFVMNSLGWAADNSLAADSGRLSFNALNPITIGHLAVTNIIACLFMMDQSWRKYRFALFMIIIFSAWCLMLTASRGPLISLIACVVCFCWVTKRKKILITGTLLSLPLFGFLFASFLNRSDSFSEDLSVLERFSIQSRAIEQALDNPVLGSAYVELVSMEYPHNLFLEMFLSLGFFGLTLIIFFMINVCFACRDALRCKRFLILLLFLQFFIAIQFSGAIWNGSVFWITAAMLLMRHSKVEFK